mmetsp:Transcript_44479/g.135583  ORF Transcript_44479/g.135583 Transcript_44479/m.135583 type:complete len:302 (-) Transcript_44479:283-1188(-)|eukprot:CAMPEP_0113561268 /NCGR_PEP_ID=MMETSP0015_2-20120614/19885_1 /TAXON_ID=2838 /ORGANISM="Odontella" /LENGTH=301 /DNA_ID=CAMNT_0000463051 /DNA_START=74 /DNA_END=979 /DNA_ORIENTATION=- /assembly_acc=CAM_ASM_000160
MKTPVAHTRNEKLSADTTTRKQKLVSALIGNWFVRLRCVCVSVIVIGWLRVNAPSKRVALGRSSPISNVTSQLFPDKWCDQNLRQNSFRAPPHHAQFIGSSYGGWAYIPDNITSKSVIYSVGIGEDTSWDEAMIAKHGLAVWGFDPTPKARDYVAKKKSLTGSHFHFTEEGLGVNKGTVVFTKPKNPAHVSMRQGSISGLGDSINASINTLENWMKDNNHSHIDILKIDIEGSEYDVLDDWIGRDSFPMTQLLVEFHHRFFQDGASRQDRVVKGLQKNGFRITFDKNGQEISFLRQSCAES